MAKQHLHTLERKDYDGIRPIMAGLAETHLNVVALLDGVCPGRVYVDAAAQPQTACLMTLGGAYYLAGDPHNQAFNRAVNGLLPRDTYFVLFCDPQLWRSALEVVLKDTYAVRARRLYYTLQGLRIEDWQGRIPGGFVMQRIDGELLAEGLKNGDDVADGICEEWGTLDAFFALGFGFCLVHDDRIVSWSFSDYVNGDRCEIGIYTDFAYRRRGCGTLTAGATACAAVAQGFRSVGWHCWANNVGSIGVAGNVGFEKALEYDIFINHWAAENVTDMTQEEFAAFAESYERELEIRPPVSGFPHIVTAKAWALSGDRGGCFEHLNRAAEMGWLRSVAQLREIWPELFYNPDLERMEEWQAFACKLIQ